MQSSETVLNHTKGWKKELPAIKKDKHLAFHKRGRKITFINIQLRRRESLKGFPSVTSPRPTITPERHRRAGVYSRRIRLISIRKNQYAFLYNPLIFIQKDPANSAAPVAASSSQSDRCTDIPNFSLTHCRRYLFFRRPFPEPTKHPGKPPAAR